MRPEARSRSVVVFAVAAATTLAAYWQTLRYGFHYDDYHVVRPWTWGEMLQVLHGSWDPIGVESAFYRPLAAWWYALRFDLFGLNAVPQHAISLAGTVVCAMLVGLFVRREVDSDRAGLFAAGLYAVHPALAYSQAVWLTNQMHLLCSFVVLISLLVWQQVRTRPALAWWPLGVLQIVGFGLKEDLVVLGPALILLTALRAAMRRDVRWPTWPVVVAGIALPVGLFGLRFQLLGRLGGYGATPPVGRMWTNFTTGLLGVLRQVPARRPWQPTASAVSQSVLALGIALSPFRRRDAYLLIAGLTIAVVFDAPFVFVTKAEQYHLVALGAVVALTGAVELLVSLVPPRAPRLALTLVGALAFLPFLSVTRDIAADFDPCSPITLRTDAIVLDWWVVPPEIQDWLRGKPAACREHRLVSLPQALATATWAYGADVDEQGRRSQWTSDRAVIVVRPQAAAIRVAFWSPTAHPDSVVTVQLRGPAGDVTVRLASDEWREATLPLRASRRISPSGMQRIDVDVSPTFVPAEVDPASADRRHLGVRIRIEGATTAR